MLNTLKQRLINKKDEKNIFDCAVEEMAEAIQVMQKFKRGSSKFTIEKLTEEIAHAKLMLDVAQAKFNISDNDIEVEQLDALKRCFKIE
jgi:hypothetical protein